MMKANILLIYFLFLSFSLFNIASTSIAVKNKLNDGINNGYQSLWNKVNKEGLPLILNKKLKARKIDPIINMKRL